MCRKIKNTYYEDYICLKLYIIHIMISHTTFIKVI